MSYLSSEQSVASGRPVELYHFWDELGNHCRITSAGYPITYNSYTYAVEPCRRSELRLSDNHKKNEMQIELSRANTFATRYIPAPNEALATVTIYRGHEPDFVQYWFGRIKQVKLDPDGVPTIVATPRTSSVSRVGRRRRCQIMCDHALYDAWCQVNAEDHRVMGTVQSVNGLVVTSTVFGTKSDGWFQAGKIVAASTRRLIKAHVGNDITLTRAIPGLAAGMSLVAYAGCDHTPGTCRSKFANGINYGGEEFLPPQNAMHGRPLI